tara:strand:+ start:304 stop:540 length:237 start_codon:yes stop_codon:yes gene_type:complete
MFKEQFEADNYVLESAGWLVTYYDCVTAMVVHAATGQIIEIRDDEPSMLDDQTVQGRQSYFYGEALDRIIKQTEKRKK